MKFLRLFLSLFLLGTFGLTACSSSSDDGGGSDIDFRVSPTSLSFSAAGESKTLAVVSGKTPTVVSEASWLYIVEASHSEKLSSTSYTLTVLDANPTTAQRHATVMVSAGSSTATVEVTQQAGTFAVSPTQLTFAAAGGTQNVTVATYGTPEVTSSAAWLTAVASASSAGSVTLAVTAAQNTAEAARAATLTIQAGGETATVAVSQTAAAGELKAKAADIARLMYPGWNLGNTLEAGNSAHLWTNNGGLAAETNWQGTKTTQAVIDFVKAQGFRAVRVPTAWVMGHITDASNVTIDAAWMKRVHEVVDYCINDGLYVILNDHWDGGWLENSFDKTDAATVSANSERLRKLWTQIATEFRDYDEHLLFAGLNEPNNNDNSVFKGTGAIDALIAYEQVFIDAVRATGGNNASRTLIVQGPSTDIDLTDQYYDVTRLKDSAEGCLMVEVHYYTPWQFCGMEKDESWGSMFYYWGSGNHSTTDTKRNATYGEESSLNAQFRKMNTKFASKGYPVIIGEYGAQWRFTNDALHNASIKAFHKAVNQYAVSNGCIPFVWGTNYTGYPTMTVLNRATLSVFNPHAMEGITEGTAAAAYPY